jgi:hypothetical protein
MELPIFQDNLRSSGGWTADLETARNTWAAALSDGNTREQVLSRLRQFQIEQMRARAATPLDDEATARLTRAAELISTWAKEPDANLDPARLNELYRTLSGVNDENPLRRLDAVRLSAAHDPAPAVILPRLIDNACDWFRTQSFGEIHPVEQAALVYLRLNDLQPYPTHLAHAEQLSLLAASLYTERAGLPPLIIFADEATAARYTAAFEAAFRMLTQPLVEFLAETLTKTIAIVLDTRA